MSALNYTVFIEKVEDGTKRQSIRAMRKHPFRKGERLHHFTGMRTKHCRRLRAHNADFAKRVRGIEITFYRSSTRNLNFGWVMKVDGEEVRLAQATRIARLDGFERFLDFLDFFYRASTPIRRGARESCFHGQIVNW